MSDLISRQAAIDTVINGVCLGCDCDVIDKLKALPTAEPRKGKWERHYARPNVYADLFWHCSECGYKNDENYAPVYHHFCPNCGCKMEGEHD